MKICYLGRDGHAPNFAGRTIVMTSCYRTMSINCRSTSRYRLRTGVSSQQEYDDDIQELIREWQTRYDATDKGEWTKYMIPDLTRRCAHQFKLDHYTSQFLIGYGDFNEKLHSCKLVQSPNCACRNGSKTVRHVLHASTRTRPCKAVPAVIRE